MLESKNYDVVVLDIMGVRGFDLLDQAVKRKFPTAMLTAHSLNPESLKRSIEMGLALTSPRKNLKKLFLSWKTFWNRPMFVCLGRTMNKLEGYFASRWGELWRKSEEKFWKDFEKKASRSK